MKGNRWWSQVVPDNMRGRGRRDGIGERKKEGKGKVRGRESNGSVVSESADKGRDGKRRDNGGGGKGLWEGNIMEEFLSESAVMGKDGKGGESEGGRERSGEGWEGKIMEVSV